MPTPTRKSTRPDRTTVLAVAIVAMSPVLTFASDARAFCRSTTCRSTAEQPCPTDRDGCPSSGAKLFWPSSCLTFAMNARGTGSLDPDDTQRAISASFAAWSNVECADGRRASLTFGERGPVACAHAEFNKKGRNVNLVMFQDNDWIYRGIDGTIAKTSVTFNDTTGEIYDADIEVNAAFNTLTLGEGPETEYDLRSVLTHEIGHFIGIAHSPDPTAVMYPRYAPGSINRELSPDDVDAVCAAFPPGDTRPCNTEPVGGFGNTCEPPVDNGLCAVATPGARDRENDTRGGAGLLTLGLGLGVLAVARGWRRA